MSDLATFCSCNSVGICYYVFMKAVEDRIFEQVCELNAVQEMFWEEEKAFKQQQALFEEERAKFKLTKELIENRIRCLEEEKAESI